MVRLALQPASLARKEVADHFEATMAHPVKLADHADLLGPDLFKTLSAWFPTGYARLWGVTPGRSATYLQRTEAGDGVAFYGEGRLYGTGRIAHRFHLPALAERLWKRDSEGRTWEFMYALAEYRDVDVPVARLRDVMKWRGNAVVQSFQTVDGEKAAALAELCGLDLDSPLTVNTDEGQAREHVEWQSDEPAEQDHLKRRALAKVLARRLKEAHRTKGTEPFFLHVDGQWGTGKSTLLRLLKDRLREYDTTVIEFNAWRNSHVKPVWWPLLTALRHGIRETYPGWQRWLLRLWEGVVRAKRGSQTYVLTFLSYAAVLILAGVLAYWLLGMLVVDPAKLGNVATTAVKWSGPVFAVLGVLWLGLRRGSRFLLWDSPREALNYEQFNSDPMNNVAAHFGWLLSRAKGQVALFIDDLDRCDEDHVVDLLEALNTLVRTAAAEAKRPAAAISFVVAADGAWIRQAYEIRHERFKEAVSEPGRPLGYLFLDKLFQLSVSMPMIGESARATYLQTLLGTTDDAEGDDTEIQRVRGQLDASNDETGVLEALRNAVPSVREAVATDAVEKMAEAKIAAQTEHGLQKFSPLLHGNPRAIKRFLNRYSVVRAVRTLEGNLVSADKLGLWVLIEIRWPYLADQLMQKPERLDSLEWDEQEDQLLFVAIDGNKEDKTDEVATILRSSDFRTMMNRAPERLTADLVRECCGDQMLATT